MKKEIRVVDEKKKLLQVTTLDERWYVREDVNVETGLPEFVYVPSVTWICDNYPKGIGYFKWLANKGWDEATALREAAGDKGSVVHQAILKLIDGDTIKLNEKLMDRDGNPHEIQLDEWECIESFIEWWGIAKPTVIGREFVVWHHTLGYAGTIDLLCTIGGVPYVIDFKTGQQIWTSAELQVSAYAEALKQDPGNQYGEPKLAILQLGYKLNKAGWKFTEIKNKFGLFLATRAIWLEENEKAQPKQKDFPLELKL